MVVVLEQPSKIAKIAKSGSFWLKLDIWTASQNVHFFIPFSPFLHLEIEGQILVFPFCS